MKELIKIANELDRKGLQQEADAIDNFIRKAGFLVDIGAWAAGRMDADTLAQMAASLPPEKLADVAKLMDPEKRRQVIAILVQDPEMQASAAEALGMPPGLAQAGLGALRELQQLPSERASANTSLDELKGLFPGSGIM